MYMSPETRRQQILRILTTDGSARSIDLADRFHVTMETIRNDLLYLEQSGEIEKEHGGAKLSATYFQTPISAKIEVHRNQKIAIARKAIELIPDGSVLYVDGGSTTLEFVSLLTQKNNLTIITTSLYVANSIIQSNNQTNNVYLSGGFIKRNTHNLAGPYMIEDIKRFRPAFAIMGTNGIQYHQGPTCKDYELTNIKRETIKTCDKVILLCDSNKFREGAVMQYASWNDISCVITDSFVTEQELDRIGSSTHKIIAQCRGTEH